jgi:hypothetical protein
MSVCLEFETVNYGSDNCNVKEQSSRSERGAIDVLAGTKVIEIP